MSTLCIKAFDKTGGWDLDLYSAQKGHEICFKSNFDTSVIEKIVWKFTAGQEVNVTEDLNPSLVFRKKQADGSFVPGEGIVIVELFVTTKSQHFFCAKREILIVPVVDCQLMFEDYEIGCDTKFVTIVGHPLCAATIFGNPFDAVQGYSCGGACKESCPQYETLVGPLIGNKIFNYGRHCIKACVSIRSQPNENQDCISLYANNFLGQNAKYPPLEHCFLIEPRNLKIAVENFCGNRWLKKFVILNFSQNMLPSDGSVTWKITDNKKKLIWKQKNRCKTLCYEFRRLDIFKIEACIEYSDSAEPKTVFIYLQLTQHCTADDDKVLQSPS